MSTALRLTVAEYDAIAEKDTFDELQKTNRAALRKDSRHEPCSPTHDRLIEYLTH